MPVSKTIFNKIGVFPIIDHYYEPLFNYHHLKRSLRIDRDLQYVNFNVATQLKLLEKFKNDYALSSEKVMAAELTQA